MRSCEALISKPGVRLEVSHEFVTQAQLLDFLAGNHLNAFLYEDRQDFGISSCLDLALAVDRPIAVSPSPMFRHVADVTPSISIGERSLRDILVAGSEPLRPLRERWSVAAMRRTYERVIDRVLKNGRVTLSAVGGVS